MSTHSVLRTRLPNVVRQDVHGTWRVKHSQLVFDTPLSTLRLCAACRPFSTSPEPSVARAHYVTLKEPVLPRDIDEYLAAWDASRHVVVSMFPNFAVHEDKEQLFVENNIDVAKIFLTYRRPTGLSDGFCHVLLPDAQSSTRAVEVGHGAPMFGKRIAVRKWEDFGRKLMVPRTNWLPYKDLANGWFASSNPNYKSAKLRGLLLRYPQDIFGPIRQGRYIGFSNLHIYPEDPPNIAFTKVGRGMYRLLHDLNVMSISWPRQRAETLPNGRKNFVSFVMVTFATRKDAEHAQAKYHGFMHRGLELHVRPWQIPRRFLGASWDSGRAGGHFSGRDQGSAVGTNWEEEQEILFRKAILGDQDRKLWVPSHKYR